MKLENEKVSTGLFNLFGIKAGTGKVLFKEDDDSKVEELLLYKTSEFDKIKDVLNYGYLYRVGKMEAISSRLGTYCDNFMVFKIFLPFKVWQPVLNSYINSIMPVKIAVFIRTFDSYNNFELIKNKYKYNKNITDSLWWLNKFVPLDTCVNNPYMVGMPMHMDNSYKLFINEYSPVEKIEIEYCGHKYRYHDYVLRDRYIMNQVNYDIVNGAVRFQDVVTFGNVVKATANQSNDIQVDNTMVVDLVQPQPQQVQPQPVQQPINCTPMAQQPTFGFTPLQPQPVQQPVVDNVQPVQPVEQPMVNNMQVPAQPVEQPVEQPVVDNMQPMQPVEYIQPVYTDPNTGAKFTGFKQPVYADIQPNPMITNFNNNQAIPNYNNMNYSDPNRDQMIADTLIKLKDTLIDMKNDIDAEKQRQAAEKSVNNHPISAA